MKKITSFVLPTELMEKLEGKISKTGNSKASIIRTALVQFLEKEGE